MANPNTMISSKAPDVAELECRFMRLKDKSVMLSYVPVSAWIFDNLGPILFCARCLSP